MLVYLVRQTLPREGYQDRVVYVCSTKEKAMDYARKLNENYGYGAKFNSDFDFVEFDYDYDYDDVHYYDTETMRVDEELAPFLP